MDRKASFKVLAARDFEPTAQGYKSRPTYAKRTTTGCIPCKAKKVKCDEAHPVCQRCRRNARTCLYKNPAKEVSRLPRATAENGRLWLAHRRVPLQGTLTPPDEVLLQTTAWPGRRMGNGTPSVHIMHHLLCHWETIFPMHQSESLMEMMKSQPLIRNVMLAMAAGHLRHVRPDLVQHRVAEHMQQLDAIRSCSQAIETSSSLLGQPGVSALVIGSSMLNMLTLNTPGCFDNDADDGDDNFSSITHTLNLSELVLPHRDRVDWISMYAALKRVLFSMEAYKSSTLSFMAEVLLGDAGTTWVLATTHQGLEGVPGTWIRFFELQPGGPESYDCHVETRKPGDIFLHPVVMLARLRHSGGQPARRHDVFQVLYTLSKLDIEFCDLLRIPDERAFWVLAYWYGLMSRFEGLWWCETMVRGHYLSIRAWLTHRRLSEKQGVEGELWQLMLEELDLVLGPTASWVKFQTV